MAIDCVIRLEQSVLRNNIDELREKLKNIDDEIDDSILNQLARLEKNIKDTNVRKKILLNLEKEARRGLIAELYAKISKSNFTHTVGSTIFT